MFYGKAAKLLGDVEFGRLADFPGTPHPTPVYFGRAIENDATAINPAPVALGEPCSNRMCDATQICNINDINDLPFA